MKKGTNRFLSVLLVAWTLAGCVAGENESADGDRKKMNMQAAANRADLLLDEVLGEIKPALQWAHGPTSTGTCDVSRMRAVMTIVSQGRRGNFLGIVERFWRGRDYRIKAVNSDLEFPAIYAQTGDGFGVSLSFGGEGQAFFEVDSPCVEPSKVAEPASPPNGPAYEGVYPIPRPDIRSAFWSAGAP
ncbi:hypothetical protein [Streptomyces sp. NPDC086010]|uniref:hypothetical protein n=1 Tax=Streptomyces sp. NPDC086010 TaxID=3365745 RepID=UPI0037D6700F